MLISVVIPFYNEIDLISRAIESVYVQFSEHYSIEVFVINDGSFTSEQIMTRINSHPKISVKVLNNKFQKGPGGARNTGIEASLGDAVAFLDADDFWQKDKLQKQIELFESGFTFICTGYKFYGVDNSVLPPTQINFAIEIFTKQGIGTSTIMCSKSLLDVCRFDNLRFSQDIDLWYRLACLKNFVFASIPEVLTVYNPSGSTKNKLVQAQSLLAVLKKNSIPVLLKAKVMVKYTIRGVINHYIRRFIN